MPRKVLLLTGDGQTPILQEVPADDEAQLQERLKMNPDLLPLEEFDLAGPMLVAGRETQLPSGAVDLIGLTLSGEVLIVEFKRGPQNSDFRHALAQLLDYGAHLWRMTLETFESTVALPYFRSNRCPLDSPGHSKSSLAEAFAAAWPGSSPEAVAGGLETLKGRLAKGSFHYILAAQRFTQTMESGIEYLNHAMSPSKFFAVELVRFAGGELSAFEARTVVRPQRASVGSGATPTVDESQFLASLPDPAFRDALQEFFELCRGLSLRFEWGTKGASIRLPVSDRAEPLTICWAFPEGGIGWMGLSNLTLGFDTTSAEATPSIANELRTYVSEVSAIPGATPVKTKSLEAFSLAPEAVSGNCAAIAQTVTNLVQRANKETLLGSR